MAYPRNNNPADAMRFKQDADNLTDAILNVMKSGSQCYGLECTLTATTAALGQLAADISFHRAKDAKRGPHGAVGIPADVAQDRVGKATNAIHAAICEFMREHGVVVHTVDLTKTPPPEAN